MGIDTKVPDGPIEETIDIQQLIRDNLVLQIRESIKKNLSSNLDLGEIERMMVTELALEMVMRELKI